MNVNAKSRRGLSGGLWVFGVAALCVAGLPSAHAGPKNEYEDVRSTIVKYGDLNLQSPAGAEELYRRINRAANKVCWKAMDQRILNNAIRRDCVQRAVAKAVGDVNNGNLTALDVSRTHKALG
jgi:UrcA family protein